MSAAKRMASAPRVKAKKSRSPKAAKKPESQKYRWLLVPVPVGDPTPGDPLPVAVELPDPTNEPDGKMLFVKGGKYVLTNAPAVTGDYPQWDGAVGAKKIVITT